MHHLGSDSRVLTALPASSFVYSSTLKTEAICSSETSVDFRRTTRRYISETQLSGTLPFS
jgi:hypothetical protein